MKVNIITFHFVHNYGAVLQCYALQEELKKMGYDVEIINYRPSYHAKRYSVFVSPLRYYKNILKNLGRTPIFKDKTLACIKCLLANRKVVKNAVRKYHFEHFLREHLAQGKRCTTFRQLAEEYADKSQIFITGSDQVWNRELICNDNSYFLNFALNASSKIAYAVSLGDKCTGAIEDLKRLTKDFDMISVRERKNAIELSTALGRTVTDVLDPTLLLRCNEYHNCETKIKRIENLRYILVYDLAGVDNIKKALAEIFKKDKEIMAVNISRIHIRELPQKRIINLQSIGPGEFITCIKNAECILTDSFHGTALSIVYHKKFWVFENPNGSLRLKNLLEKLNLLDRFVKKEGDVEIDFKRGIDYGEADRLLLYEMDRSRDFIKRVIKRNE